MSPLVYHDTLPGMLALRLASLVASTLSDAPEAAPAVLPSREVLSPREVSPPALALAYA